MFHFNIENTNTQEILFDADVANFATFKAFENKYIVLKKFKGKNRKGFEIFVSEKDVSNLSDKAINAKIANGSIKCVALTDFNEKTLTIIDPKNSKNSITAKIIVV